jgi:hypothetical protein
MHLYWERAAKISNNRLLIQKIVMILSKGFLLKFDSLRIR